jgi:hypothetical protein
MVGQLRRISEVPVGQLALFQQNAGGTVHVFVATDRLEHRVGYQRFAEQYDDQYGADRYGPTHISLPDPSSFL